MVQFALAAEHLRFFRQHHWIEFSDLIEPRTVKELLQQALLVRFQSTQTAFNDLSSEQLFIQGRDLWRESPQLKKSLLDHRLASIAMELLDLPELRLGYTQLLPKHKEARISESSSLLLQSLQRSYPLEIRSSFQGVRCGLILCLEDAATPQPETSSPANIFALPKQAGHGVYVDPTLALKFQLEQQKGLNQSYMLIVFVDPLAQYVHNPLDSHVYYLKQLGYTYGDRLKNSLHPLFKRR